MKLAAYLRVSTDGQAERGNGLADQRQKITKWAKTNGHKVTLWTADEGISGGNGVDTRVGLYEALNAIESHDVDGLVIRDLDRLARKLTVQEAVLGQVWRAGGVVFTADGAGGQVLEDDVDDPMKLALRQIVGVINELERNMINKRLRDGKRVKAERGGYVGGGPPFGYRAEGRELVPDEKEQALIARMRAMHEAGDSTRAIAAQLNAEGITTKRGRPWSHVGAWAVLNPDLARKPRGVRKKRQ